MADGEEDKQSSIGDPSVGDDESNNKAPDDDASVDTADVPVDINSQASAGSIEPSKSGEEVVEANDDDAQAETTIGKDSVRQDDDDGDPPAPDDDDGAELKQNALRMLLIVGISALIIVLVLAIITIYWFARGLDEPDTSEVESSTTSEELTT